MTSPSAAGTPSSGQVVDVGSLNGTYVNRQPVRSAVLANGDEIQIGKFRLVFLTAPRPNKTGSRLGTRWLPSYT